MDKWQTEAGAVCFVAGMGGLVLAGFMVSSVVGVVVASLTLVWVGWALL